MYPYRRGDWWRVSSLLSLLVRREQRRYKGSGHAHVHARSRETALNVMTQGAKRLRAEYLPSAREPDTVLQGDTPTVQSGDRMCYFRYSSKAALVGRGGFRKEETGSHSLENQGSTRVWRGFDRGKMFRGRWMWKEAFPLSG